MWRDAAVTPAGRGILSHSQVKLALTKPSSLEYLISNINWQKRKPALQSFIYPPIISQVMNFLRPSALSIGVLALMTQVAFAASPLDPLAAIPGFTPTVSFSESHSDRLVTTVDRSDPEFPFVFREVVSSESISVTVVANITGIDLAALNGTTAFSLELGGLSVSGTLGDDPRYAPGKTSIFIPALGFDDNDKPIGKNGTKLSWTATRLTLTVTGSTATEMPGTVELDNWSTNTESSPVRVISTVSLQFGPLNAPGRNVYITGNCSAVHRAFGSEDEGFEEFDLVSVSLAGGCEFSLPVITITSPAQGAAVGAATNITGKTSDGHGIAGVEYSLNPEGPDPVWFPATTLTLPEPSETAPPWGKTNATWTIALSNLPKGTSTVWIRSGDISRNYSAVAVLSVVNPLASLLQSRWDGLLNPTPLSPIRGALSFSVTSAGGFTGKIFLETGPLPLTGVMKTDGTMNMVIKRLGHPDLTLVGSLLGAETHPGGLYIDGAVENAAGNGASFRAFRSPYSKTQLANANLAGRFHVKVDPPADPLLGYSYLIATTQTNGTTTVTGRMADGQAITWTGVLGVNGQLPVFVPLYTTIYKTKGSISSLLTIDGPSRSVPETIVHWFRPLGASDLQFPTGYDVTVFAEGKAYTPPPAGTRVMGLPAGVGNATVVMGGDGITTDLVKAFTVNANNSTAVVLPNPNSVTMANIPAATGMGTGSFKLPGTTTSAAINYLIVGNVAYGHYSAAAAPGTVNKRFGGMFMLPSAGPAAP